MTAAVEVVDLVMDYRSSRGDIRALDGASLSLERGEVVGVVGESGSGKSTLAAAIGRLPAPHLTRVSGEVIVDASRVFALDEKELRRIRRSQLAYIFQDPVAALDPTMKIGRQIDLALKPGRRTAVEAVAGMGLDDIPRVLRSYPHQISGGMAQRVAIAMAMARRPACVIADEPTAALDASIKAQILDLLAQHCRDRGSALLLLSHDLHAIRTYADKVAVMYGGRVVEFGPTTTVFDRPAHPYTRALQRSSVGREQIGERVASIPGAPQAHCGRLDACAFEPRCAFSAPVCAGVRPEARRFGSVTVLCHRTEEIRAVESAG
jgi:peptide/nickel transport system ATP-binding protein